MVTRLIFPIHTMLLGMSEYTDFDNIAKIQRRQLITSWKVAFPVTFLFVFFGFGLINFIIVALEDDELKPLVIVAISSTVELVVPLLVFAIVLQQSFNMDKLVYKYMSTCSPICEKKKEFYRDLTIKKNMIQLTVQIDCSIGFMYHYFNNSNCFDSDTRFFCGLFTPLWFPFETNYFPVKEAIVFPVTVMISYLSIYLAYTPFYTYIFSEMFYFKVKSLIKFMRETSLNDDQDINIIRSRLYQIVKYHRDLYECFLLMRKIVSMFSIPLLLGFVPFTAALVVSLMKDPNFAHFDELVVLMSLSYLWCHTIQSIRDMGEMLEETAYSMNWYLSDKSIQKDFLIFFMKLQEPLEMKAIFFLLNRSFFVSLIKTMYSFMMVMYNAN